MLARAAALAPVSYTHLDVYKRQALGSELHVQGFLAPVRKDSVKFKLHLQQARRISGSAGRDPLVA